MAAGVRKEMPELKSLLPYALRLVPYAFIAIIRFRTSAYLRNENDCKKKLTEYLYNAVRQLYR